MPDTKIERLVVGDEDRLRRIRLRGEIRVPGTDSANRFPAPLCAPDPVAKHRLLTAREQLSSFVVRQVEFRPAAA